MVKITKSQAKRLAIQVLGKQGWAWEKEGECRIGLDRMGDLETLGRGVTFEQAFLDMLRLFKEQYVDFSYTAGHIKLQIDKLRRILK